MKRLRNLSGRGTLTGRDSPLAMMSKGFLYVGQGVESRRIQFEVAKARTSVFFRELLLHTEDINV
jgi:hypothetical protein